MLITVFALTASVGLVAAQEAEPVELSSNVQTTTSGGEGLAYRNTTDAGYQLNKSFTFGSILYNTTTDACTGVQTTYLWYEVNYTNRGTMEVGIPQADVATLNTSLAYEFISYTECWRSSKTLVTYEPVSTDAGRPEEPPDRHHTGNSRCEPTR